MINSNTTNPGRAKYNLTEVQPDFAPGQSGTAKAPACYEWISILGGTALYTNGVPNACTYDQFATVSASFPDQFPVGPKEIPLFSTAQSAGVIARVNKIIGN